MSLVVLLWGANFAAIKVALPSIPPLAFAAIRFTVGSAIMAWLLARRQGLERPPPDLGWRLVWLGLLGNTAYQLCFMLGLQRTSATNTSLLLAAMPTVVTVSAGWLGLEALTARRLAALALATAGVVAVIAGRGFVPGGELRGDLLILAGVLCWAAFTLGLRQVGHRMSALGFTAWTTFTGAPGLLLAGIPDLVDTRWGEVTGKAWAGLAYSTTLSFAAAYILYSDAVRRLGAGRAVLYTCATPLVASATAMLVLGERPTLWHGLGALLIVTGVALGRTESEVAVAGER
jgi:drug/metabolite transporter (DMT)-like permease